MDDVVPAPLSPLRGGGTSCHTGRRRDYPGRVASDDDGAGPGPSVGDGGSGTTSPTPPDADLTVPYPVHWEADVVLRDGGTAHVRPIRSADAGALQEFHVGQSERSTYFRFFAPLERLPERDLTRFTQVDHSDRVALVAVSTAGESERIIAVGRYDRIDATSAEVAFNVADDHHGRGLGSVLLEHLAAAARERGIRRFTAEVLPQNSQMLAIFREAGFAISQHLDDGIISVSFVIDPTVRSLEVMADREHRAEARSVSALLSPRSVLVVVDGGSHERLLARTITGHLVDAARGAGGGDAPVVHVLGDPHADPHPDMNGTAAGGEDPVPGAHRHQDLADVPGPVDLVVLAVPAATASSWVRRCASLSPRAALVLTGGFAETGPEGLERQRALVGQAHRAGMRVLGPASYGFFRNPGPGADAPTVNASLAAELPVPGRLALFCQSAPLAVAMLASARRRGLGLSTFVSSGNRADVSGNDLMQFWSEDEATDVVGLYLESIGNPRKFARVARRLSATRPVVVVSAGRSGHVVPAGHVVRRTHAPRRVLDELLRQSGVVRVETTHQLLDVAQLLTSQPLPAGRRVAVVSGSEPLAALVAEAADSAGLTVAARLTPPPGWSGQDGAGIEGIEAAWTELECDAVVVVHVPTIGGPDPLFVRTVAEAAARSGRTTVACVLGLSGVTTELTSADADGTPRTVPAYATPEDAVLALAAAMRYAAWRATDHGVPLAPEGIDRAAGRALVDRVLGGRGTDAVVLSPGDVDGLLAAYGLTVWPSRRVGTVEEAVRAAEELGWPVALKSTAEHLRHRLDLGGVRLDIAGPGALAEDIAQMRAHLDDLGEQAPMFEIQRMAPAGAACVIRSTEDPRFGPVVSFGLAGDAVDLLGDISYGVAPLTDGDVRDMVRSVRTSARLFGYHGLPALDVAALEDVLARVAVMADDLPELASLDLHPVVVGERGASVLAAHVALRAAGRSDSGRRTLPG